MPKLILHLGLAKTGTTTLQVKFFPQVHGYLGKSYAEGPDLDLPIEQEGIASSLMELWEKNSDSTALAAWASRLDFNLFPTVLISNETFSRWRTAPGRGVSSWPVNKPRFDELPRRGSHPIVGFLSQLKAVLPRDVELISVLTLRSQFTYLPSHAAQAREQSMMPIVRRILRRRDEFILWDQLVRDLIDLQGPEQHLTLLFEDGVEANARDIVRFCGLTPKSQGFDYRAESLNQRRKAPNSWERRDPKRPPDPLARHLSRISKFLFRKRQPVLSYWYNQTRAALLQFGRSFLRFQKSDLQLSSRERRQIELYTRASNDSLARLLERDLKPLGY